MASYGTIMAVLWHFYETRDGYGKLMAASWNNHDIILVTLYNHDIMLLLNV